MKTISGLFLLPALAAQVFCSAASAQDAAFGAGIYQDHCVVCHGPTGDGDGIVGALFANRPAALSVLARENNGVFPTERVIEAIYGRSKIPGHGDSKMPIWGDFFLVEALKARAMDPADAAMIAQGRVLSVVAFLQSLQVE